MIRIAVIIPFFQKSPGILRVTLQSILAQNNVAQYEITVIIIDDGSPVPAQDEIEGLAWPTPFSVKLVKQPNGGVAAARNKGLSLLDQTTTYIAFLDSDDSWHENHLSQGIEALERGHDFYFCDNSRPNHHPSQFSAGADLIRPFIAKNSSSAVIDISSAEMLSIMLQDLPSQTSTAIYRRAVAPALSFDTAFKMAGEDMIFFMRLCQATNRICFSPKVMVECGGGLNIYFGNLDWNAPGHFRLVADNLRSHGYMRDHLGLTSANATFNNRLIAQMRRKLAFLALRSLFAKRRIPDGLGGLLKADKEAVFWFPWSLLVVAIGYPLGIYKPE